MAERLRGRQLKTIIGLVVLAITGRLVWERSVREPWERRAAGPLST